MPLILADNRKYKVFRKAPGSHYYVAILDGDMDEFIVTDQLVEETINSDHVRALLAVHYHKERGSV